MVRLNDNTCMSSLSENLRTSPENIINHFITMVTRCTSCLLYCPSRDRMLPKHWLPSNRSKKRRQNVASGSIIKENYRTVQRRTGGRLYVCSCHWRHNGNRSQRSRY